jgi:hypothetical protein
MRDRPDIVKISYSTELELEEMFELRAFGHDIAAKATVVACRALTAIHNEAKYAKLGPAFRNTTAGEVAMVDRELQEELYGYCEDGSTTFIRGLDWCVGKGYDDCKAFQILEPVQGTLPDGSVECPPEATICNRMGTAPTPRVLGPSARGWLPRRRGPMRRPAGSAA